MDLEVSESLGGQVSACGFAIFCEQTCHDKPAYSVFHLIHCKQGIYISGCGCHAAFDGLIQGRGAFLFYCRFYDLSFLQSLNLAAGWKIFDIFIFLDFLPEEKAEELSAAIYDTPEHWWSHVHKYNNLADAKEVAGGAFKALQM